jgi:capsular polysaccharide biosynthesis protein
LPSIATLADEVLEVEKSQPWQTSTQVSLGRGFATLLPPDIAAPFQLRTASEPIRTYRLRDVVLDASIMALVRDTLLIPETLYMVSGGDFAHALTKSRTLEPTDPNQHYIVAVNRTFRNYYHWTTQILPAIDWGVRNRRQSRLTLLLPPLQPRQEEMLGLLGYADVPRLTLTLHANYALASAEYSEFLGARMPGLVSTAAAATFARLRDTVPPAIDGPREIYIARTDATRRPLLNEAELIDLLERQGVSVIAPGTLPVTRQIALFRRARLIIGPHGAGLTNIGFCEPGSHVYELLCSHYPNISFNRIAQTAGVNYWADMFAGEAGGIAQEQPWRVDLDVVAARLDAIRAHMAATMQPESAMEFLRQNAAQVNAAAPRHPIAPPARRGFLRRLFGRS